jgi:ubiquinone/menaquinone biosynthesis C-methylase UbiE
MLNDLISRKDRLNVNQDKFLGDKYRAMYEAYYESDAKVAEKRSIAAGDIYSHLRDVVGARDFESVLDVGAGEGSLLANMQEHKFAERLYACEISASGLKAIQSRKLTRLVEAKLFDGYHIPFPDKSFELATCSHVLEHVEHERLLLAEMKRVAKHIAVEVPLENRLRLGRNLNRNVDMMDPFGHINFYNQTTFLNLLRTSGLRPTKWKVSVSSVRYEQYLYGKGKGLVKNRIRQVSLAVFPRLAQLLFVYVLTVYCEADA